ncbi:hypothetical protein AwDysgo_15780 [Bacteroidales bacterium]|nr:hypothetical protein AwDysgo_15780 [Bacteroidales bacterium]
MRKLSLTLALCLVASLTFGQKKAVSAAKNELKSDKPNIEEARGLIKGAMEDPETKDDANTWYTAGLIDNKVFDTEKTKELIGQKPNEELMYNALKAILPLFLKADELDNMPDEKGKIKLKFQKDIKAILNANRMYYINGGVFYFDQKNYAEAYDFFDQYVQIPTLSMFSKEKDEFLKDSVYVQIKFYKAIAASQIEDGSSKAIAAYEDMKNDGYKENEVYQYLCYEYEKEKDTENLMIVLKEGVQKFPEESYYLLNLINQYIYTNQNEEAIAYLTRAIDQKPDDAQLYDVLGRIYENKKELPKAKECFEKALAINPDFVEAIGNLGRLYFNEGVESQSAANDISDNKLYNEAVQKAKSLFKAALPYFEKAHKIKPEEKEYMVALRGIYYNLNMSEFDAMDAKLSDLE